MKPLELFEISSAPCFELVPDFFRMAIRGDNHDMHMIGTAIHRKEMPPTNFAMVGNRRFDDPSLLIIEMAG
jgi:hypothetical protein